MEIGGAEEEETPDSESFGGEGHCLLIWEGQVQERLFVGFNNRLCGTEGDVKSLLERYGASHYFDLAKNFVDPKMI